MRISIALLFIGSLAFAGDPSTTSRTVAYHNVDIVPISVEVQFTTLIELPKEESILEVTCGSKDNWAVNWTGNLAYLKPALAHGKTNINLITTSGNVYSFLVSEVSGQQTGHADLKLFIEPSDAGSIAAMKGKPKYVSADAVEGYRKAAETAELQLKAERVASKVDLEREKMELRATYPATIKHDYSYPGGDRNPFNVTAIFHDEHFTYIEATPQELPSLYETKDNKPSLIQFEFDAKTNRYSVPKVLDSGYFKVGKQKLTFKREG